MLNKVDAKFAKHKHPQLLPYIHIVRTHVAHKCVHSQNYGAIMSSLLLGKRQNCFWSCLLFINLLYLAHHDDDKVKPTPGVGEVLHEAQCQPLNHHLHGEYHSEDPVHVVEDVLQDRPLLQVDVLGRQGQAAHQDHCDHRRLEVLVLDQPERLDPEVGPALPERGVVLPGNAGQVHVALYWAAVGGVLRHHHLLRVHVQHELRLDLTQVDDLLHLLLVPALEVHPVHEVGVGDPVGPGKGEKVLAPHVTRRLEHPVGVRVAPVGRLAGQMRRMRKNTCQFAIRVKSAGVGGVFF